SMKLSSTGEIIGTFLQDRATAIAGRLGHGPRMIPVTISLQSGRAPNQTFHFGVVNDQLFGPLMTYASILNTLGSYERQYGSATFGVRGSATVRNHDAIAFNNLFSGADTPSSGPSAVLDSTITFYLGYRYDKSDVW